MFSSIVAVMAAALLAVVSTLGLWPVQPADAAVARGADGLARIALTDVAGQRTQAAKSGLTAGSATALRTGPIDVETFVVAGLSWAVGDDLPADADIRMRVREDGGWSDWLDVEPDHASDDATTRPGTDPFITGGANAVQVLVTGSSADLPDDLRLTLVSPDDDGGAASSASALSGAVNVTFAAVATETITDPAVTTPAGTVVTRSGWGLSSDDEGYTTQHWTPKFFPLQAAVVHHTAGTNSYSIDQSAGIVHSIWQYHAVERGWGDIGYNFLVDKYGQMFEGRRHSLPESGAYSVAPEVPAGWSIEAAHAAGYNKGGLGISALGDFTKTDVKENPDDFAVPSNPDLLNAISQLAAWKLNEANLDVIDLADARTPSGFIAPGTSTAYPAGTELPRIFTHQDVAATLCPGALADPGVIDKVFDGVDGLITRATDTTPPGVSLTAVNGLVTLTAADDPGSTPAIFHTTDGSQVFYSPDWDVTDCGTDLVGVTNPRSCVVDTRYTDPFTISKPTTVSYLAVDGSANTSPQQSAYVKTRGTVFSNTAPAVSITAPVDGASFSSSESITFSGSATDTEDGELTATIVWTSDGVKIGTGGSVDAILFDGTHTITATVTDSGGVSVSSTITITVGTTEPPPTGGIELTVVAYKDRGAQVAELEWTGATAAVDVYRDGIVVVESVAESTYTHVPGIKGGGSATYQVCEADSTTTTCSNEVVASW